MYELSARMDSAEKPQKISSSKRRNIEKCNEIDNIDQKEKDANESISRLIANITILADRHDPLIKSVKSPKLLIRGLTELKDMVEMVEIKHSIVNQIKFLITNQARTCKNSRFEGHMLHSVISGNPGTGKTTAGRILAKIWMALGFVNKSTPPTPTPAPILAQTTLANVIVATVNETYRKRIGELEESNRDTLRKMDQLREVLTTCQNLSGEIRRKSLKLRPNRTGQYSPEDIEQEWDSFLNLTRKMRFGFDDAIRQINSKNPVINTGNTGNHEDPYENMDPKFVIAAREDFIAEYLGQTAPKTKKVLESARGGVLFIDEAYSLCNMDGGSKDKYGEECLATINEFMSLYPDEIIIIFAGYKDKLMSSIFKAQPGLMRRCAYFFEIKDYTIHGLAKIFKSQLAKNGWVLADNVKLEEILKKYIDLIHEGGGFTEKLAFFSKLVYGTSKFDETITKCTNNVDYAVLHDSILTDAMICEALEKLRDSSVIDMEISPPPPGMYN